MALGLGFSSKEIDPVASDSPLITAFSDLSVSQCLGHLTLALLMSGAFFPHWNATLYKSEILQASCIYSYVYESTLRPKRMKSNLYKTPFP